MTEKQRNIQGRAHNLHVEFVDRAARSLGKTQSQYVAETMIRQASRDLREPIPELPAELVEVAAATHGMTRREFEKWTAEQWAVKEQASGRKIVPVGGFEKTPPASAAMVRRPSRATRAK